MSSNEKILAALAKLREPFPENQISQLPKPTKKREEMDKLPKATCKICGGYHATSNIVHLSYVGHAALTDRLLEVDPLWTWEPLALDQAGLPLLDRDGGMWIKLTICGVTRLGYGDAQGKTGGDATKERIGDALRNAAMRFGAALDLWHKGDLHVDPEDGNQGDGKGGGKDQGNKGGNQNKTTGKTEIVEPTKARSELLTELRQIYHGNLDEMADALRHYSSFQGSDGEKYLTLANLEHPTNNEKMHKWFGSALGKLRKDQQPQ